MTLRQSLATLPRDTRDTLFLLVVIAWVMAPQVAHLPAWASLMAGAVLLWRGRWADPPFREIRPSVRAARAVRAHRQRTASERAASPQIGLLW